MRKRLEFRYAFAYAEPQLSLADCTTELNEQPTNHNPAYTGQLVEEPPITIDLEHDFEEEGWVENILRELPVNSLPILIIIIDTDFTDLHRRYSKVLIIKFLRVESKLKNHYTTLNLR